MKKTTLAGLAIIAVMGAAAVPVLADTDTSSSTGAWGWCPGMVGQGNGMGNGMERGHGKGAGYGRGQGSYGHHRNGNAMGNGQGRGIGQMLMSPEEHVTHMQKIFQSKTMADCQKEESEQHALMAARAKEKGVSLPGPRRDVCEIMKSRGLIK